jgi:hypothetical protein
MPRYYFYLHDSGVADPEGEELANDATAIAEAKLIAHDLRGGRNSHEKILVKNEKNDIIYEEPIGERSG